jgi:hypothetical protein
VVQADIIPTLIICIVRVRVGCKAAGEHVVRLLMNPDTDSKQHWSRQVEPSLALSSCVQ